MPEVNLANQSMTVDTGLDSVVIVHALETIPGGRTLDVAGFTPTVIRAGHVVIKETATGTYKPHPISGGAYAATPASHTVEGVVMSSVMTDKAMVSIMVRGTVNQVASPYAPTAGIKTALPLIRFTQD